MNRPVCAALFATLGFTGCVAERDYADQWDQGSFKTSGIGVPRPLELGQGAMQGDLGAVTQIDSEASSVSLWNDPGYAGLTINLDRGQNGTGFTTIDLSGVGLQDERFQTGEIVVFEMNEQNWDENVYVTLIGCSDLGTNHWDATADKIEVRLDPETPEEAKRVDFRARFPGYEGGFGQPAQPEQTVSGSAVVDLTQSSSGAYY